MLLVNAYFINKTFACKSSIASTIKSESLNISKSKISSILEKWAEISTFGDIFSIFCEIASIFLVFISWKSYAIWRFKFEESTTSLSTKTIFLTPVLTKIKGIILYNRAITQEEMYTILDYFA